MIKSELIETIQAQVGGLSQAEIMEYVSFVMDEIEGALSDGDCVRITKFGVFETITKKSRMGRNPKTMEEYEIPEHKTVRFRPSRCLRDRFKKS